MGFRESKNRPVATNFQFLKILALLGQLLVGACLPQTLLRSECDILGIYLLLASVLSFPFSYETNLNKDASSQGKEMMNQDTTIQQP